MSVATSTTDAPSSSDEAATDALIKNIGIPPRPSVLVELQQEMGREDPDTRAIARMVAGDVALTVALLRVVNSPAFALSRRCESVEQAANMLGLKQVSGIITSLVLRKVLRTDGPLLTRFWDVSAKRSHGMARLARGLGGIEIDTAQSFGLFCDVGIPLLMQRFPDYGATLKACNEEPARSFTEVEQERHNTDHALIGSIMARTWGLPPTLCQAIRQHHDYSVFRNPRTPDAVLRLIAMSLVTETAIQRFAGLNTSTEWNKGGDQAASHLMLADQDLFDWVERLVEDFAVGKA